MKVLRTTKTSAKLTFLYCLPAILAISIVLGSYYQRTNKVACFIHTHEQWVNKLHDTLKEDSNTTSAKTNASNGKLYTELRAHPAIEAILGKEDKKADSNQGDDKSKQKPSEQLQQLTNFYLRKIQRQDVENDISRTGNNPDKASTKDNDTKGKENKSTSQSTQELAKACENKPETKPLMCEGKAECVSTAITGVTFKVWRTNAIMIAILAILPYLLLGTHLGFSNRQHASFEVRCSVVNKSWWMKFLIAMILAYGWVYVINPTGRGTGTLSQFLISVDLYQTETLPELLKGGIVQPIIAGFLGWYLYMLTYFFSKVFTHDVLSTNAYGLMFQKFLFTYGIAIILPSVQATSGPVGNIDTTIIMAFMIGFFPMSAFSMLKDTGIKMLQGGQPEKGQLHELPGISRWQILRLEEEGIDSMGALAAHPSPAELRQNIPAMSNVIDYWIDIARLYTILGQTSYQAVKKRCMTASEFVRLVKKQDTEFTEALKADHIANPEETARIISTTFTETLNTEKEI